MFIKNQTTAYDKELEDQGCSVTVLFSWVYCVLLCFDGFFPLCQCPGLDLSLTAPLYGEALSPWWGGSWECRCRAGPKVVWQKLGIFSVFRIRSHKRETWSHIGFRRESRTESQAWSPNTVVEGFLLWNTPAACENKCSLPHAIQSGREETLVFTSTR